MSMSHVHVVFKAIGSATKRKSCSINLIINQGKPFIMNDVLRFWTEMLAISWYMMGRTWPSMKFDWFKDKKLFFNSLIIISTSMWHLLYWIMTGWQSTSVSISRLSFCFQGTACTLPCMPSIYYCSDVYITEISAWQMGLVKMDGLIIAACTYVRLHDAVISIGCDFSMMGLNMDFLPFKDGIGAMYIILYFSYFMSIIGHSCCPYKLMVHSRTYNYIGWGNISHN